MAGTFANPAPRFASRRSTHPHARRRLLTEPAGAPLESRPTLVRAPSGRAPVVALGLSLALHAGLIATAAWLASPLAPAPGIQLFPVEVIWEEPAHVPAPAPTPAAPAERAPSPAPRARSEPLPAPVVARAAKPSAPQEPAPSPVLAPDTPAVGEGVPRIAGPATWLRGLAQPAPRYPRAARRRGAEGTTWLRVDVAATGRVVRVAVERSAGHRDLDRAAVAAVRTWRFAPLPEEMDASDLWLRIPVEFRLR